MPSLTPSLCLESAPTLIAALRAATAPIHEAVERLPVMVRLTGPAPTPADYCRYLSVMAQVYGVLEPPFYLALEAAALGAAGSADADQSTTDLPLVRPAALGLRPKYQALCADLAAYGRAPPPRERNEPSPPDLSTALGGLYVLEGSTLGGRVVARHLRRHLGDPLLGGTFLDFHGDQASAAWKAFGLALEELVVQGLADSDQVIAGACAVFREVYRLLATLDQTDPAA